MDKDNAVKSFLDEFDGKKEANPFEDNLKDPFAEAEVPEEVVVEEEEKPLPFNKDPKVQKFIEKEISKRMADFKPEVREVQVEKGEDKVTDMLTRLIGNNTPEKVAMVKEFKDVLGNLKGEARAEALQEIEARSHAETQADLAAQEELETAFENIEENYDVDISSNSPLAKKTRQEFVSFVERIAPKDRNGDVIDYPDMNSAWETFSEMRKTSQPSRAKELASRGMARSSESTVAAPAKRLSWDSFDDVIAGKQ